MVGEDEVAAAGLDVEVIDPVWLSPLDIDTIVDSVRRTGILLVVDTGWTNCGASAEILARTSERLPGLPLRMQRLGFTPAFDLKSGLARCREALLPAAAGAVAP